MTDLDGSQLGVTTITGSASPLCGKDDSTRDILIREAVDSANSNALRLALYQVTGDPELAAMRLEREPVRSGAQFQRVVAKEFLPALKKKATAFLLSSPTQVPKPPDRTEARTLIELFSGETLNENHMRFGIEELAFDEYPRDCLWTSKPSWDVLENVNVIIIGAGISGIAAAIQLKRLGLRYKVVERQADIGGTWNLNDYPEARVDTSSFMYQFKFEKNYPWSEYFASQAETKSYLKYIVNKFELIADCEFNTEVTTAEWDENQAVWHVTMRSADGRERQMSPNFIVSASGLFSTPNLPNIPGIEKFGGAMFHTSQWDHNFDFRGTRVALIGTGSSGVQLMPALAREAGKLTVFQRTANWLAETPRYRDRVPPESRLLFEKMPYYWNWYCYSSFDTSIQLQHAQTYDHEWRKSNPGVSEANERLRVGLLDFMRRELAGREDLIEKCTPNHPPLARRLVVDNGFYRSLLQQNVELVTERIQHITTDGIFTRDGIERRFDLVVLGAGFQTSKYLFPVHYVGRDGMTLEKAWKKDGPRSYLGVTMPDFPNLFMMYGPNGQSRSTGFYSWAEIWARYIAGAITQVIEGKARSATIKRSIFDDYNTRLDAADKEIVWQEGEGSYLLNEHGRQSVNVAFRTEDLHAMLVEPDMSEFDVR